MKNLTHAAVLFCLANETNDKTGKCCPRVATIAEQLGACEKTVRRTLRELEKMGLVTRERQTFNWMTGPNLYHLNDGAPQ